MLNFATKNSVLLPEKKRKKENARILYNIIDKINVFFFLHGSNSPFIYFFPITLIFFLLPFVVTKFWVPQSFLILFLFLFKRKKIQKIKKRSKILKNIFFRSTFIFPSKSGIMLTGVKHEF
jgi:hypothetical protein